MNPDKKIIIEGERHLKQKEELLEKIDSVSGNEDAISLLLNIKREELAEQVVTINKRLEKVRNQFIISFEKESAEANEKMPIAIMLGQKYVGKEPTEISSAIQMLIAEYKEGNWDQERKNDIYFALCHITFFQTKVK